MGSDCIPNSCQILSYVKSSFQSYSHLKPSLQRDLFILKLILQLLSQTFQGPIERLHEDTVTSIGNVRKIS